MIHGIKSENFEEFIKSINDFSKTNNVFATQTHIDFTEKHKNTFYAFVWYNTNNTEKTQPVSSNKEFKPSTKFKTEYGKPTKKMRYKIEKTWETEDGREFLEELGYDGKIDNLNYDKAKYYIGLIHDKEDQSKEEINY